jgi:hypothetical protein
MDTDFKRVEERAMTSARRNTTRLARLAALGLCVALAAGCNVNVPPPRAVHGKAEAKSAAGAVEAKSAAVPQVVITMPGVPAEPKVISVAPKGPPAPKSPPRPGSPPVVRERVASTVPYASEAEADEDAIAQACALVAQKMAELDPPIEYRPSPGEVRSEFLRKDSRTVRPPTPEEKQKLAEAGIAGDRVFVEYDVEVTANQVRELRSQDRVSAALRVLGVLFALALAGFLFLRADEWTKGYLTSWLALAAVTLAGGAAAALIFI